jgi:serine/threonine protein kinase
MIGQTLAHYRVSSKLGTSEMDEVYLAKDTRLDRQVALEIVPENLTDISTRPNWLPIFEISSGT